MRIATATFVMIASVWFTNPARAGFQWITNWQVTNSAGSSYSLGSDLPAGGSVSGSGTARLDVLVDGTYSGNFATSTTFTRTFSVSGSPGGWSPDISASTFGSVTGLHGTGTIAYSAKIDATSLFSAGTTNGGGGLTFSYGYSYASSFPPPPPVLADGTYTLTVTNNLSTSVPGPPFSGPGSFGGATDNYSFQSTFRAVPEPLLAPLSGLGVALLTIVARRRDHF